MIGAGRIAPLGLAFALAGCAGPVPEQSSGPDGGRAGGQGGDAGMDPMDPMAPDAFVPPMEFDMHHLLEDGDILGGDAIEVADVQGFLEMHGSYLAGYDDSQSGLSASEIIVERSRAYGVSPLYMLARIQTESSLVTSGTADHLEAATGCGCPDGTGCNPDLGGFGNQIECAAMKMRGYYDDLDAGSSTIAGWSVGVAKDTGDPCSVTPANKATAALYTYTPWVGAYASQCGRMDIGGSSLVALAYNRFLSQQPWDL